MNLRTHLISGQEVDGKRRNDKIAKQNSKEKQERSHGQEQLGIFLFLIV